MGKLTWQLSEPLDAVVFDCDSTLSQIEGITVLAKENGVEQDVVDLTELAMNETGLNEVLYAKRLNLVRPTLDQVVKTSDLYYKKITPDVEQVIHILRRCGKAIFVVSAGLYQSVAPFAERLDIPLSHVHAVETSFDKSGHYLDFDHKSAMVRPDGKREVAELIQETYPTIAHIGDGMNDIAAAGVVERFIGYGGSCYREVIANLSDFYVKSLSLLPLLPLLLTELEVTLLPDEDKKLYAKGLEMLKAGDVLIH
jgi:phosphoserine phosphatase